VTKTSQGQLSVLENYHFVFAYEQGRVSSIQVNPTNHTFTLENVHKSFKASIRALLRSLRDLPRLPGLFCQPSSWFNALTVDSSPQTGHEPCIQQVMSNTISATGVCGQK
jgi:hypothetical protein